MNEYTLGLIETYGFIGAVEALDVAVKAADVKLVSCELVKGGLVTILITGDVSSVKAAVEASTIAVNKLGVLRNTNVIARACDGVWDMLQDKEKIVLEENELDETKVRLDKKSEFEVTKVFLSEEDAGNIEMIEPQKRASKESKKVKEQAENKSYKTREELEKIKVTELRTMARELKINALTKKQIKYGKKEQLIESILTEITRR